MQYARLATLSALLAAACNEAQPTQPQQPPAEPPNSEPPKPKLAARWAAAIDALPGGRALNIAHRGARSLAPENTLAAGRVGFERGAHGWEIDVQVSRDGELILMHDDTLERTTNAAEVFPDRGPWYTADFTLAELRSLDAGSWFIRDDPFGQLATGALSADDAAKYVGEKIPTLAEALALTAEHDGLIDIEIKQMPYQFPGVAAAVRDQVIAAGVEDRVIVSSFDHSIIVELEHLDARMCSGPIASNRIGQPGRYIAELLGGDAYFPSVDVLGGGSLAYRGSPASPGALDPTALNVGDLQALREAGVAVFVWTINDEANMRSFTAAGVTGIITDFPQLLAALPAAPS